MMVMISKNKKNDDTSTINSSTMNERKAVIETIIMRLTEKQSLEYLKEYAFEWLRLLYVAKKRKLIQ
jgi:hypothetical protein